MAKDYDKEMLLADYHTGAFSQRALAKKYKVSLGTVSSITKGIEKKTERIVQKKIELIQDVSELSAKELNAVEQIVQFKASLLNDVQLFANTAMQKAGKLLEAEQTGQGFKALCDGVDKLTVTHGINPRFATSAQIEINNTNATQSNLINTTMSDNPIEAARVYQKIMRDG